MDIAHNKNTSMKKQSNNISNSINCTWNNKLSEEKANSLVSQMKLLSAYKKTYEELHQKLNYVKDLTKNLLPSSVVQFPIIDWKHCKIDDYINIQVQAIEESHFLEESTFIENRLQIDPIISRKRKRSVDDAKLDSATEKRVESYKRSRFHEKARRMTRDLKEEFINKKLAESTSVLNKISEFVIKQNPEVLSPAVLVNEAIFGYV